MAFHNASSDFSATNDNNLGFDAHPKTQNGHTPHRNSPAKSMAVKKEICSSIHTACGCYVLRTE